MSHCKLPVNFKTQSHLIWKFVIHFWLSYLKTIDSANKNVTNQKKPPPSIPSTTVLYVPEKSCEKQAILILKLISRKCMLKLTSSLQCQLLVSLTTTKNRCTFSSFFLTINFVKITCWFCRKWLVIWTSILRYVLTFQQITRTLIICLNANIVISSSLKWFQKKQNLSRMHNVMWKYCMQRHRFGLRCAFTNIKIRMEAGALGIPPNYLMHSVRSSTNSTQNHFVRWKTFQMRTKTSCMCYEMETNSCAAQFWILGKPLRMKL